ncbi:hypothetical protein [Gordonia sp. C13]|uniref:hypothetical protein n=1 Tax=Gordonia sp. C13 TaxID=2935078 RepID=UPI00200A6A18|nr:hypothetical protein [Gordonia sp. C13]MCK8614985.1 hypothetical protein [Gordonia sp. C13]
MLLPFPIPVPIPLVPRWFPRPERRNDSDKGTFGVSPDEIEAVVRSWRGNGIAISAIDTAAIGEVQGSSSRIAHALRDTADPARRALESIGHRLLTMSELLDTSVTTTVASDARVASTFDLLRTR